MSKVSIIMPVYNNRLYVESAIRSILSQTYKNWELIIINDKSTDGVEKILEKYQDNEKIKVINNEKNVGCYISLNKGIKMATGNYIGRLDSDDYIHNEKLSMQVNILDNNPNVNIVFTYCKANFDVFKRCMATTLIRREVFDKIGYYDSVRIAADNEFKLRYLKVYGNKHVSCVNKVLYFIRVRFNSLSRSNKTGMASIPRRTYKANYMMWHRKNRDLYIDFPLKERKFPAPNSIL